MTHTKDSPEVIEFMALFKKFRSLIDDDPSRLDERINLEKDWPEEQVAADDKVLHEFGGPLFDAAQAIRNTSVSQMKIDNGMGGRRLFAPPVDPKFIKAWRDYETRYASMLDFYFGDQFMNWAHDQPVNDMLRLDVRWERFDEIGEEGSSAIKDAIYFADELSNDSSQPFVERFMGLATGTPSWDRLAEETDFDLRGIFRRHRLLPFFLIPRHVSARHNSAEKSALLINLKQAQEAFIFGVPRAALALMRSILEVTLKTHYHAIGENLNELIDGIGNLPDRCSKLALHQIRMLANDILHANKDEVRLPDPRKLEIKVVRLLYVLRTLIEGAPASRP
ncbi:MAG: DUF4145 domain-containing protein [Acidimicrobiales bacterium]